MTTIEERKKKMEELDVNYKRLLARRAADPTRKQSVVKMDNDFVEVDNMISDCIQVLNDAGFSALYSCSGHEQDFFTKEYIVFGEFDYDKLLTVLNDIPEFVIEYGSVHLSNHSKNLVIHLSFWADSERWVPESRDQNFKETMEAFNKLKEAVSNGKN